MKRSFSLLLVLALSVAVLFGCNKEPEPYVLPIPDGLSEIEFWVGDSVTKGELDEFEKKATGGVVIWRYYSKAYDGVYYIEKDGVIEEVVVYNASIDLFGLTVDSDILDVRAYFEGNGFESERDKKLFTFRKDGYRVEFIEGSEMRFCIELDDNQPSEQ